MVEHPVLINRPIVVTPKGVKLCRPSEAVLDILPHPNIGPFTKEDGEVIINEKGTALSELESVSPERSGRCVPPTRCRGSWGRAALHT